MCARVRVCKSATNPLAHGQPFEPALEAMHTTKGPIDRGLWPLQHQGGEHVVVAHDFPSPYQQQQQPPDLISLRAGV